MTNKAPDLTLSREEETSPRPRLLQEISLPPLTSMQLQAKISPLDDQNV